MIFILKEYDVAVAFGGVSNENEISVITGTMAINVLKSGGLSVLPVFISQSGNILCGESLSDINNFKSNANIKAQKAVFSPEGIWGCNKNGKPKTLYKISCVLNCCHGGYGEGGGLSGLCRIYGLPLASAGVFESALFINKYYTKLILNALKVKCAPYSLVRSSEDIPKAIKKIGFPIIVKPRNLGSSIGVVKAETEEEVYSAVESALCLDDGAVCEKYFKDRREINCAAYYKDGEVITSLCEEAKTQGEFLSYDDKYSGGGTSVYPADLPVEQSDYIIKTTQKVYSALEMRGIVRFDYIISQNAVYLSEVNTVPGSLSYYLLSHGFKDFYSVLSAVIKQAKQDKIKESKKNVIKTGILDNFNSNACKTK